MGQSESRPPPKFKTTQNSVSNTVKTARLSEIPSDSGSSCKENKVHLDLLKNQNRQLSGKSEISPENTKLNFPGVEGENHSLFQSLKPDFINQPHVPKSVNKHVPQTTCQLEVLSHSKGTDEEIHFENSNQAQDQKCERQPVKCPTSLTKGQINEKEPVLSVTNMPHAPKYKKQPAPQAPIYMSSNVRPETQPQEQKFEKQSIILPLSQPQGFTYEKQPVILQANTKEDKGDKRPSLFSSNRTQGQVCERESVLFPTTQPQEQKIQNLPVIFCISQSQLEQPQNPVEFVTNQLQESNCITTHDIITPCHFQTPKEISKSIKFNQPPNDESNTTKPKVENKPFMKIISSGNPFLQTTTNGMLAKDSFEITVNDVSLAIPPNKTTVNYNFDGTEIEYRNKGSGDDSPFATSHDTTKGLGLPLSANQDNLPDGIINKSSSFKVARFEDSSKDETVKKTLKHVEMIAESLTSPAKKNQYQQESVRTQYPDPNTCLPEKQTNYMLHNCIVKMKNICDKDKASTVSLQKDIVMHLKQIELFTSVLKICPIVNADIYSVCETIKTNLNMLEINSDTENAQKNDNAQSMSKGELFTNHESLKVSTYSLKENQRNDANHDSKNVIIDLNNTNCNKITKENTTKDIENKNNTTPLNPFMALLNQLPDDLIEEKKNISLKNTNLYCRICEKPITFELNNLIEHLKGKNHCALVSEIKQSAFGGQFPLITHQNYLSFDSKPSPSSGPNDECLPNASSSLKETELELNIKLPPNYRGVLDLISKSVEEGFNIDVDVFICLVCDFFENDNIKARNHVAMDHKYFQNGVWHFCQTCLINIYGTNTQIKEHCLTKEHLNVAKFKYVNAIEELSTEKCLPDTALVTEDLDRRSVCSSKSDGSSRLTPYEILLSIAKDKQDKNMEGPFGLYCQVCSKYIEYSKSKTNHFETEKHKKSVTKQNSKKTPAFMFCSICKIHLFVSNDVWVEHQNLNIHKELLASASVNNCESRKVDETNHLDSGKTSSHDPTKAGSNLGLLVPKSPDDLKNNVSELLSSLNECGPHYEMMKKVLKKNLEKKSDDVFFGLYCHPCQLYFFDQKTWELHLSSTSHGVKINSPEYVRRKVLHDCENCNIRLICDESFFSLHLESLAHKAISRIPDRRQVVEKSENEEFSSEYESISSENDYESEENECANMRRNRKDSSKNKQENSKDTLIPVKNGIYFTGLPKDSQCKEISDYFGKFGPLKSCNVDKNQGTGYVVFRKKIDSILVLDKKTVYIKRTPVVVKPLMARSKSMQKQRYSLHPDVVKVLSSSNRVVEVVSRLQTEMTKSYISNQKTANEIRQDLSATVLGCRVVFFGSQVTGLATVKSDFDIYIDYDGKSFYTDVSYQQQRMFIQHLQSQLTQRGSKFAIKDTILEARVPIIRVVHMRTNTLCDISCRSGLSVENSHLVRLYLEYDPRVRWLVVAIKYWMETNKLVDRSIFTSYATVWLVLFFLMRVLPPVICPVTMLQKDCQPHTVARWDCRFHRDMKDVYKYFRTSNQQTELELLSSFFNFYARFPDYEDVVLCPLNGLIMERKLFATCRLPKEFSPYIDKIQYTRVAERLRIQTPICLEDPFDLAHNITKGVCRADLMKFKTLCDQSYELCQKLLSTR